MKRGWRPGPWNEDLKAGEDGVESMLRGVRPCREYYRKPVSMIEDGPKNGGDQDRKSNDGCVEDGVRCLQWSWPALQPGSTCAGV